MAVALPLTQQRSSRPSGVLVALGLALILLLVVSYVLSDGSGGGRFGVGRLWSSPSVAGNSAAISPPRTADGEVGLALKDIRPYLPRPTDAINVTLWIPKHVAWERQYVVKDLVEPAARGGVVTVRELDPLKDDATGGWNRGKPKNWINRPDDVNIVIFHGIIEDDKRCHSSIVEKAHYYQPALAFIFSDEVGLSRCITKKLSQLVPVVMRHYTPDSHGFKSPPNVFSIPLGTMNNQEYDRAKLVKKASERAGAAKNDRREMIEKLSKKFPERQFRLGKPSISMAEVAKLYHRAVFVPNSRGFLKLDCFRLYEATRAGAIPVVVGPADEIEKTFGRFMGSEGKLPPWVFAPTWDAAIVNMEQLLESNDKLNARQAAVLDWWAAVSDATVKRIRRAIEVDWARRRLASATGQRLRSAGLSMAADMFERRPDPMIQQEAS